MPHGDINALPNMDVAHLIVENPDDPYKHCETGCNHDLVRGILAENVMGPDDGPYTSTSIFGKPTTPIIENGRMAMPPPRDDLPRIVSG